MHSFHILRDRAAEPGRGHNFIIMHLGPYSLTPEMVTRDIATHVLAGAAPVVAYDVRESDGVLVFPDSKEGGRLARCFEAQLTLCAAGLWPTT